MIKLVPCKAYPRRHSSTLQSWQGSKPTPWEHNMSCLCMTASTCTNTTLFALLKCWMCIAGQKSVPAEEEEVGRRFIQAIRFTAVCTIIGMAIKIFPTLGIADSGVCNDSCCSIASSPWICTELYTPCFVRSRCSPRQGNQSACCTVLVLDPLLIMADSVSASCRISYFVSAEVFCLSSEQIF